MGPLFTLRNRSDTVPPNMSFVFTPCISSVKGYFWADWSLGSWTSIRFLIAEETQPWGTWLVFYLPTTTQQKSSLAECLLPSGSHLENR